jgi:hypothetical protein
MEKLEWKKLSQAIKNTTNKIKFCASLAVTELDEDQIDGLSRILEDCADELEQAANTVELLQPSDFSMKRNKGKLLRAVPFVPFVQPAGNGNGNEKGLSA